MYINFINVDVRMLVTVYLCFVTEHTARQLKLNLKIYACSQQTLFFLLPHVRVKVDNVL